MSNSREFEPDPGRREWPEKRFHAVYALILLYTVLLLFLLWAFSRAFD